MARLQAFYKGSPEGWLRIPIGMLRVLSSHLPRLEAEQALSLHAVMMSANGTMAKDSRRRWLRDVEGRANAGQSSVKATERDLATLPIQVIREG